MRKKFIALVMGMVGLCAVTSTLTSCGDSDNDQNKPAETSGETDVTKPTEEKIDFSTLGLSLESKSFKYDGTEKTLTVTGNIPSDLTVSYTGKGTDAGKYKITAHFTDTNNKYKNVKDLTAEMTIEKADYDLTNVQFNDMLFDYDEQNKTASIVGNLPEGLTVSFEGDNVSEIGSYNVVAHFTNSNKNYNDVADKTAKLIINKGDNYHYVTFNDASGNELVKKLVKDSEALTDIPSVPEKEGYTGVWNYSFDSVTTEMECVPTYTANKYTITYDVNGGDELSSATQEVTYDSAYTLVTPTREGYTFAGWYTDDDDKFENGTWTISDNVNLVASWEANKYTITYDLNGGDPLPSTEKNVYYDDEYTLLTPTRKGYTFNGWYLGTDKIEEGTWKLTNDVTLVANWVANKYTITYDVNGGKALASTTQDVIYDSAYTLAIPERDGYTFGGWYLGDDILIDGTWDISNNVTLVAAWDANSYSLKCDVNGGDPFPSLQNVTYDSEYQLVTPTRKGYTFKGWYLGENKVENGIWKYTSDITLVASWEANKYQITYVVNGGDALSSAAQEVTYDSEFTLATTTRRGYTFKGWYLDNDKVEVDTWKYTSDITLIAQWEANKYTITYDVNGGDALTSNTQEVVYDSAFTLVTPTRDGYSFRGWYSGDTKVESGKWTNIDNLSVKAKWEVGKYIITYDVNGGKALASTTQEVTYDAAYTLATPTRDGYTFKGWFLGTDKVENGTWKIANDVTLKASWEANKYTITYDVNGGDTLSSTTLEVTYDSEFTLVTPTKTGYTFKGWYNGSIKVESGKWTGLDDVTLKASWEANKYTITYDVNGGNPFSSLQNVTYDSEFTLVTPTKTGYTFKGWYNGSTKVESGVWTGLDNISVKASWEANKYTITYDVNGGDALLSTTLEVTYDSEFTLVTPTKTGYTFKGWYNDSTKVESGVWTGLDDISVKASWEANKYTITYDVNGGNPLSSSTLEVTYDSEYTLAVPTRDGYTFEGWYVGIGKIGNGTWKILEDITIKASWKANKYTITFDVNGGDDLLSTTQEVTYDAEFTLVEPTKTGYAFKGWYNGDTKVKSGVWTGLEDISVKATWEACDYLITYDVNGGNSLDESTQGVIYDSAYTLVTPSRKGYTFKGWYLGETKVEDGIWKTTNDITLKASWEANTYKVTYTISNYTYSENVKFDDDYKFLSDLSTMISVSYATSFEAINWTSEDDTFNPGAQIKYTYDKNINLTADIALIDNTVFEYTVSGTTATIKSYLLSDTTMIVPAYIHIDDNMYDVTTIDKEAFKNKSIETAVILEGITTLKANAFAGCTSLAKLYLPSTLTTIEDSGYNKYVAPYADCTLLTSVGPKGSGKSIEYGWTNSIPDNAFRGCSSITEINLLDTIETIGYCALAKTQITEIKLPSSLTTINEAAFENCNLLEEFILPEGFKKLCKNSLGGCTNIAKLYLPSTLTTIEDSGYNKYVAPYANCTLLTSVGPKGSGKAIEYGWTDSIPANAFRGCSSITEINLLDTIETIGYCAFVNTHITEIKLPSSLTTINEAAFENCSLLEELILPEGFTKLCKNALGGCTNLAKLYLPSTLRTIENSGYKDYKEPYANCPLLTSVGPKGSGKAIEYGWTDSIPANAFRGCNLITEIILADTITSISEFGFADTQITSITLPSGLETIGTGAFIKTQIKTITLPSSLTTINEAAFENCSLLEELILPEGLTKLCKNVFTGCTNLAKLYLPSTLTIIDYNGNYDASYANCTLLTSVGPKGTGKAIEYGWTDSIPENAFRGCEYITEIILADTITSISKYGFADTQITSITLPSGLETIGIGAFEACTSLKEVIMSVGITLIDADSFKNCNSLTTVYYEGSASDWSNISNSYRSGITDSIVYYYSETEPTDSGNYWHYVSGVATKWD